MKKYKILYGVIYILAIVLVITKGIKIGVSTITDSRPNLREFDRRYVVKSTFLICNLVMSLILFVLSLKLTKAKDNEMKHKSLLFWGSFILLLFIPLFKITEKGGVVGYMKEDYFAIGHILLIPFIN